MRFFGVTSSYLVNEEKYYPKEVDFRNQRVKKALYAELEPNRNTPQYVILRCYELVTRKLGKIPSQRGGLSLSAC